jgi:hypothetical protein
MAAPSRCRVCSSCLRRVESTFSGRSWPSGSDDRGDIEDQPRRESVAVTRFVRFRIDRERVAGAVCDVFVDFCGDV